MGFFEKPGWGWISGCAGPGFCSLCMISASAKDAKMLSCEPEEAYTGKKRRIAGSAYKDTISEPAIWVMKSLPRSVTHSSLWLVWTKLKLPCHLFWIVLPYYARACSQIYFPKGRQGNAYIIPFGKIQGLLGEADGRSRSGFDLINLNGLFFLK